MKPVSLPKMPSTDDTRWLRGMWRLYIVVGLLFGAYMAINDVLSELESLGVADAPAAASAASPASNA